MNQSFSVSMCVYGKDDPVWFKTAVDSILYQTVEPNEVIIVVDGPVPNNLDKVIKEYEKDIRFKIIRFLENKGHGEARRAGLTACSNELVAIMDSDDVSIPTRFELQLKAFENNSNIDIVGGQIVEFQNTVENVVGKRTVPLLDKDIKQYLKKRCPMNLVSVMFKKSSIEKVGGFIDWYCEEDYFLWVRMYLANMVFANVADTLVKVRVGKDMYRRRGGKRYFESEKRLQKYMLQNKIITRKTYMLNCAERYIVQVLMPSQARSYLYNMFARDKEEK